jgi:hypothetical protein
MELFNLKFRDAPNAHQSCTRYALAAHQTRTKLHS